MTGRPSLLRDRNHRNWKSSKLIPATTPVYAHGRREVD